MMRTIAVTIPVRNKSSSRRKVTYAAGSLIEVQQAGMQNVVAAETVVRELQPGESAEIRIRCYCINNNLSWPQKAAGKLTKMTYVGPTTDQSVVWAGVSSPDVTSDRETQRLRELRTEMENVFSLEDLQLITADLGIKYQNISGGDRLDLKCLHLLLNCHQIGRLGDLVTLLRQYRPQSVVFKNTADEFQLPPLSVAR